MTTKDMLAKLIADDDIIPTNTRVRVIAQDSYSYRNFIGKLGRVRYNSPVYDKLGIELDGIRNGRSSLGVFYFRRDEIEIVTDNDLEENNMAINVDNITGYTQAIKIKFVDDSRPCGYVYASFEPELKVGDLVVVKPAHHDIALARVDEILEGTDYEIKREVICKVDTSAYSQRVKLRNQAAELKAKMQERARQLQDIALYQMLAKDDPAMQALLDEYQALGK